MSLVNNIPRIIELPSFLSESGRLSFIEENTHLPFKINNVQLVKNIITKQTFGGFAFKQAQQMIVSIAGSYDIEVDNGFKKNKFRLESPDFGLYVPQRMWVSITNFSPNSCLVILSSANSSLTDKITNYSNFLKYFEK